MKKALILGSALLSACAAPKNTVETPAPAAVTADKSSEDAEKNLAQMCRETTDELGYALLDPANECDPMISVLRSMIFLTCSEQDLAGNAGKVAARSDEMDARCEEAVQRHKKLADGDCVAAIQGVVDYLSDVVEGFQCDEIREIRTRRTAMDDVCQQVDEDGKPSPYRDPNETPQDISRRVRARVLRDMKKHVTGRIEELEQGCKLESAVH